MARQISVPHGTSAYQRWMSVQPDSSSACCTWIGFRREVASPCFTGKRGDGASGLAGEHGDGLQARGTVGEAGLRDVFLRRNEAVDSSPG